jgi:SAM-dependent methyltransferase
MHRTKNTDWDQYYQRPAPAARFTRRITARLLRQLIRAHCGRPCQILELGGANSCFVDDLRRAFQPTLYHVVDYNEYGLNLLAQRCAGDAGVTWERQDVRSLKVRDEFDLVYSVGLVEHFDVQDTRRAIQAHFAALRPGGVAIITFPTPTWLYRATRGLAEAFGIWAFPDERPIRKAEALGSLDERMQLLDVRINWPIFLTQMIMVARRLPPVVNRIPQAA